MILLNSPLFFLRIIHSINFNYFNSEKIDTLCCLDASKSLILHYKILHRVN